MESGGAVERVEEIEKERWSGTNTPTGKIR
jgi:hypothetical protein